MPNSDQRVSGSSLLTGQLVTYRVNFCPTHFQLQKWIPIIFQFDMEKMLEVLIFFLFFLLFFISFIYE
jgi:hypothetical protein